MKKEIYLVGITVLLTASVQQAMAPGGRKIAQEIGKPGQKKRLPDKRRRKPKDKPIGIIPYPVGLMPKLPPIKPIPISPDQLPAHGHGVMPPGGKKEIFQQFSLLPLPVYQEGEESVLVLDTSLVKRELLLKKMLAQNKNRIDEVLTMRVMDLIEQNKRLDRAWTLVEDMQEWFNIFNSQVDAVARYSAQFKDKTCPERDAYCKDAIEQVTQLQKQLKVYLDTLAQRYGIVP